MIHPVLEKIYKSLKVRLKHLTEKESVDFLLSW